jgi:hypothetical protein
MFFKVGNIFTVCIIREFPPGIFIDSRGMQCLKRHCRDVVEKEEQRKLDKYHLLRLPFVSRQAKILAILVLVSAIAGCIGSESKKGVELNPSQNFSQNITQKISEEDMNVTAEQVAPAQAQNASDGGKSNQVHLILQPNDFNRTGKIPITLKVVNPRLNETVLTVFKPEYGQEWYDQTNITYLANHNWTQNYTIKPKGNINYVKMYVQITENNTVVKRAAWNFTIEAPVGNAT